MAHLALVRRDGDGAAATRAAAAWELPPVSANWPTSQWRADDFWRGQHPLRLPAALMSGTYVWRLQVYPAGRPGDVPAGQEPVELGTLRVDAPDRLWEPPALEHPINATLSDRVTLLGFNLQPPTLDVQPPATLTVTLAWQGQAEMATSYRVFLHLLGPDGGLLTQSDGEPGNWTRPTTGWAPGEIVLDERVLTIPDDAMPGVYTLLTGLYDPAGDERLALPDGATSIQLTSLQVASP